MFTKTINSFRPMTYYKNHLEMLPKIVNGDESFVVRVQSLESFGVCVNFFFCHFDLSFFISALQAETHFHYQKVQCIIVFLLYSTT